MFNKNETYAWILSKDQISLGKLDSFSSLTLNSFGKLGTEENVVAVI